MTRQPTEAPPSAPDFAARRRRVHAALDGDVMVLGAAPVRLRSRDTEYPYRADSELYYLTGCTDPDVVAVLSGGSEPDLTLFVPERDETRELWSGRRMGPDEARERHGADHAWPASELDARLPGLLASARRIHARLGAGTELERLVIAALVAARARGQRHGTGPRAVVDPGQILDEMRLIKDAWEIRALREAAAVTVEGHRQGLAALAPGLGEWAVQARIDGTFRAAGASGPGFETIVGAGANACVLHYVSNSATVAEGDLVLMDAGAEVGLYHGDVTRTAPASGRFTAEQRALHDLVDAARAAGVAAAVPGATVGSVHDAAVAVLVEGLVELGVLTGSPDTLIESEAYKAFFPHNTSHWLGLDVHDPGDYARDGSSRVLEPGMVLTVEPGLYVPTGADGGAARFAGMGIRIEDDLLVTADGPENLTGDLPGGADAMEALVAGGAR
ncbi:MAG: aminopeptidase P N-terminal domain-containing protein [Longimicrobiales bacterium]